MQILIQSSTIGMDRKKGIDNDEKENDFSYLTAGMRKNIYFKKTG